MGNCRWGNSNIASAADHKFAARPSEKRALGSTSAGHDLDAAASRRAYARAAIPLVR